MELKYPTSSKTLLDRTAAGDEISRDEFYDRYCGIVRSKAAEAATGQNLQIQSGYRTVQKFFSAGPSNSRLQTITGRESMNLPMRSKSNTRENDR